MPILRCIVLSCLLLPTLAQAQTFNDVTATAGITHKGFCQSQMTGGVVWLDYDQDGDEDLYTTGGLLDNVLYRNNGDGTFSDVTQAAGLVLPARNTGCMPPSMPLRIGAACIAGASSA